MDSAQPSTTTKQIGEIVKQLKINGVVVNATQFITDDCHKVYLLDSPEGREQVLSRGWSEADFRPVSELPAVWDDTCPLRFISSADLDRQYIAQSSKEAGKVGIVTYGDDEDDEASDAGPFKARPLGELSEDGVDLDWDDLEDLPEPPRVDDGDFQAANDRRAWRGVQTLVAYAGMAGQDEFESTFGDMVSDLQHACDALGIEWDAVTDRGDRYYSDEIGGRL